MPQRYLLPVRALLQTLRDRPTLTTLTAALPVGSRRPSQARQVVLILGQGRVLSCTIHAGDGRLLAQGGSALKILERLAPLPWQILPAPSQDAARYSPTRPEHAQTMPPLGPCRRLACLAPPQWQALSHRHRQVFALADGTRSVASIATLLHLPIEVVLRLLDDLRRDQLID